MLLREVEYARPSTVDEAVALLADHDGRARPRRRADARQRDEGPRGRARRARRPRAISRELRDDLVLRRRVALELGAMVTASEMVAVVRGRGRAARARRGGARRSPTSRCETAARSAATSASTIRRTTSRRCSSRSARRSRSVGTGGERIVGAEEFFLGVYTTAVEEGELLTKVSVPTREAGHR